MLIKKKLTASQKETARWNALTEQEKRTESMARMPYLTYRYEDLVRNGRIVEEWEDVPNVFCRNRSTAGDACGECVGCVAAAMRLRIEVAINEAVAAGAISEEWAMSLYANLSEPPEGDEHGWALLTGGAQS